MCYEEEKRLLRARNALDTLPSSPGHEHRLEITVPLPNHHRRDTQVCNTAYTSPLSQSCAHS